MIQDIAPSKLNNVYSFQTPTDEDFVLLFEDDGKLVVNTEDGGIRFTTGKEIPAIGATYLFSLDNNRFFLAQRGTEAPESGFARKTIREMRNIGKGKDVFAAFTAYHLWRWYEDNRFCGRCGTPNEHHGTERAMRCPRCGNVIYPRLNPAVIVGVIKDDSILITRYRTGYAHNALVAGFTEIGETLEETVAREVMEETGIQVKNIRYYKSQPWGMAQDILMGFYCDADGDGIIRADENELKSAEWVRGEELVLQPNDLSLTNEMMKQFKYNYDQIVRKEHKTQIP